MPSLKKCLFILLVVTLASCRSGKIPCPDIGGSNKLAFLNKLGGAGNSNGAAMGERVTYDKNGLLKKKKYKYLKTKPRRKKYKN